MRAGLFAPGDRESSQPSELRGRDRLERVPVAEARPRLDLDEHDGLAVAGDEVDLAETASPVALDHRHAERLEMVGGELFAVPTELRVVGQSDHLRFERAVPERRIGPRGGFRGSSEAAAGCEGEVGGRGPAPAACRCRIVG